MIPKLLWNKSVSKNTIQSPFLKSLSLLLILMIVIVVAFTTEAIAQSTQTFTNSGNYSVPSNVTTVTVQCWGAGGKGSTRSTTGGGGGGGGGAFACSTFTVSPGNVIPVVVGLGGNLGIQDGQASYFGSPSIVIADGGEGPTDNSILSGSGGSASASLGFLKFSGGNGGTSTGNGAGGGGAAGLNGEGSNGTNNWGGNGNGLNSGRGGARRTGNGNGRNGFNYGGGGGGARRTSGTRNGGRGANGLVVVSPTIWGSPISGINPSASNPFTNGQVADSNVSVSGISYGLGLIPVANNDRFNARGFVTSNNVNNAINANDYFEFTITPNPGYKINFNSFLFSATRSSIGPSRIRVRSSANNYLSDIGPNPDITGGSINLTSVLYQNVSESITFRVYGMGSGNATGELSIDNFFFFGTVVPKNYLTSFFPTEACEGEVLTLNGLNLSSTQTVKIDGLVAAFNQVSDTQIDAVVPTGASSGIISISNGSDLALSNSNSYTIDCENTGEFKGSYNNGNIRFGGILWSLEQVMTGSTGSDFRLGSRSLRFRGRNNSQARMLENKSNGIGNISFKYRRFGNDEQVEWMVEYSQNNGTSWTQIGSNFSAPNNNEVRFFNEVVNIPGEISIRIRHASGGSNSNDRRFNIDDLVISDYDNISTIEVNSVPNQPGEFITSTSAVCRDDMAVVYTVPNSEGASFIWNYSGTGATINGSGSSVTVDFSNSATSGTLSVYAENLCGSSQPRNLTITVDPAPAATITPTYCLPNGNIGLTSSSASSYLWNTGETTSYIEVDQAGTYSVILGNTTGCSAGASIALGTELVTNGTFSAGNTGFMTGYSYRADVGGQSELYPEGTYAIVPNANSVHTAFRGRERNNGTGNIMVINGSPSLGSTVWSQDNVAIQPNTTYYFSAWGMSVVNGNNAVLQFAINGNQVGSIAYLPNGYTNQNGPYNWVRFYGSWNSGPLTTANLSIVNLNTIFGGNDFALDDISFSTLAPIALESSPIVNGNISVCEGSPLFLNANTVGGAAPFNYLWQGPNGFTSLNPNPTITSSASSINSGTYEVTVTDALGCSSISSVSVVVNVIPEDQTTSATNQTICSGTSTQIEVSNSEIGVYYQLVESASGDPVGSTVNGNGANISLETGILNSTTTFIVTATKAASGCSRQLSNNVTINVTPTPNLHITNQAACSGLVDLTLPTITAGSVGSGALTYWEDLGATTAIPDPTAVSSGTYYIQSAMLGCVDIEPVVVVISTNPSADFDFIGSPFCSSASNPSPVFSGDPGVFSSSEISYYVNFEGTGETKTAYASGNVSLSGIQWNLTQALIGTGGTDWKFNSRSLRLQGSITSSATMLVDKPNGIGVVSFNYRRFSSDAQVAWKVEYSTNGGVTWIQAGGDFTADNIVRTFYAPINVSGNARVRIVHSSGATSTSVRRINIDDISITDLTSSPLVFYSSSTGEIDLEHSNPGSYLITNTITPNGACSPVVYSRVVTITPSPVASFQYGSNSLCQSINTAPVLPTFLNGGQGGVFSRSSNLISLNQSTGAINISASIPGNYAVVNFLSATGGCAEVRDTAFITINPYTFEGSVSSTTSSAEVCLGESAQLFASGTSYQSVLLSENFNGNINGWTRINNSVGGNLNNAAWTLRPNNYNSDVQFRSNDNSQFYLSHSRNQNGSITESILISPSVSTIGYTSLQLDFWHYFRFQNRPGENARVEISTDGGNWTTLQSYTSSQGGSTNFQNVTLDISAYTGYPNVYVRFMYYAQGRARYWAIDNITISGNTTNYDFTWTSDPDGYNSVEQNPVVSPITDAFYIVNTTNTYGCSIVNSPLPITVKPVGELITTLTPQPICSGEVFTYEPEANLNGTLFTWIRPAVSGLDNPEVLVPQSDNPSELLENSSAVTATAVYIYTTTYDGCSKVENVVVQVHPLPSVTVSGSESVCNGSEAIMSASAFGGTGSLSYQWLPDIGLNDANNQITSANLSSESQDYTVIVTDENNCSVESDVVTITNIGFGGTPGMWIGSQDSDWNNCLNWDDGIIPNINTDVLISDLAQNACELSGLQVCNNLTIESSGDNSLEFVISGGAQLAVNGDVFINKLSGNDTAKIVLDDYASLTCNDFRLVGSAFGEKNAQLVHESPDATLNIIGDLIIGAGGYIDLNDGDFMTPDGVIKLSGDLQYDGEVNDFDQGNGILELDGSLDQHITALNGLNLQNLKLNKPLGGTVFLNNDIEVESNLNLMFGKLDLAGNTLKLGSLSQVGTIDGASSDSYIIAWKGSDNGTVVHHIPNNDQNYFFPVGDENDFTPFDLDLDQANLDSALISLKLVGNSHPNLTGDESIFLNRYWIVEPIGISNPLYTAEYVFANSDVMGPASLLFPAKYNSGGWQSCIESASNAMIGSGSVNTANNTLLWTGITSFSEFTGVGNGTALPIELLDFTADQFEDHVDLKWITSSEINNSHFIIERSIDTKLIDEIARVEGAGNSNTIRTYSTIDLNPMEGISYYRLKQVDFNGDFSHSEWVAVNYGGSNHLEIEAVYCDKANGYLLVRCSNPTSDKVVFNLIDASGRLITTYSPGGVSSNWNGSIPSQRLRAGSYILRFDLEGKSAFKKFVIQ